MKMLRRFAVSVLLGSSVSVAATLATVDGVKISDEDVNNALLQATQGRVAQLPQKKQEELKRQFLEELIAKQVIYEDAKKQGIVDTKEYKEQLKKIIESIKKDLAIKIWQKRLFESIKISDEELRKYYNEHRREFMQKEALHARHILLKSEKEAQEIIKKLKGLKGKALKEEFIKLAGAKSIGPSAANGGDLGYFSKGQMVPEFEKAAFSTKVGQITKEPVKTQFGYHLIYVEDKKSASTKPFSEVKSYIEQRLKMEKFRQTMQEKLRKLKGKAKIEYAK